MPNQDAASVRNPENDIGTQHRRGALRLLIGAAAMGWASLAAAQTCLDPKLAGRTQGTRRALNYKDISPDPKRHCGICAFFTAAAPACGTCAMLSGGPVAATAVCDSWSPKA